MKNEIQKKPIVIEAMQFDRKNISDIRSFVGEENMIVDSGLQEMKILTLEGNMKAQINDWIIRGVNGEFYPCKPDIFEKTYEVVE